MLFTHPPFHPLHSRFCCPLGSATFVLVVSASHYKSVHNIFCLLSWSKLLLTKCYTRRLRSLKCQQLPWNVCILAKRRPLLYRRGGEWSYKLLHNTKVLLGSWPGYVCMRMCVCACVCFFFSDHCRRQSWDHSSAEMEWRWILGRSPRTQWYVKNPHLEPGKNTWTFLCVCLGVFICVPLSIQQLPPWVIYVGYTVYTNLFHNNWFI